MMSLSQKEHHKILGMPQTGEMANLSARGASLPSDEAGYALVALIALMTLMALFAMAAAPSIVQQTQREREKEAIFRGRNGRRNTHFLQRTIKKQIGRAHV